MMQKSQITPMISVIMAAFNGEKYISEAIDSILCQTYSKLEFIIIDDCSNDQTPRIISIYASKDKRIRIIANNNNVGSYKSANLGLSIAKGKYIARMDADDISRPARFAKQVEFLEKHQAIGILGTAYDVIDEKGKVINKLRQPVKDEGIRWQTLFHNSFCHPTIMVRKSVLDQNNIQYGGMRFAQDYKFTSQILKYSKGANLPEFLVQWRKSKTQISFSKREEQQRDATQISEENIAFMMGREFLSIAEVEKLRNLYCYRLSMKEDELPLLLKWMDIFHAYLSKNEFRYNEAAIKPVAGSLVRVICSLTMRKYPFKKIKKIISRCIEINPSETFKQMIKYSLRIGY